MTLYGLYDQGKAFLKGSSADLMILLYLLDDNQYIYTAAHWIQVFHSLQVPRVQLEDFFNKTIIWFGKGEKQCPATFPQAHFSKTVNE